MPQPYAVCPNDIWIEIIKIAIIDSPSGAFRTSMVCRAFRQLTKVALQQLQNHLPDEMTFDPSLTIEDFNKQRYIDERQSEDVLYSDAKDNAKVNFPWYLVKTLYIPTQHLNHPIVISLGNSLSTQKLIIQFGTNLPNYVLWFEKTIKPHDLKIPLYSCSKDDRKVQYPEDSKPIQSAWMPMLENQKVKLVHVTDYSLEYSHIINLLLKENKLTSIDLKDELTQDNTNLLDNLKVATNLTGLSIDFRHCHHLDFTTVMQTLNAPDSQLKLKSIALHFHAKDINEEKLEQLLKYLKKPEISVENLSISISASTTTGMYYSDFFNKLESITSITTLSMKCSKLNLSSIPLAMLQKSHNIKTLDVASIDLTDTTNKHDTISKLLTETGVENLILGCYRFSKELAIHIADIIKSPKCKLRYMYLDILTNQIPDESNKDCVEILAQACAGKNIMIKLLSGKTNYTEMFLEKKQQFEQESESKKTKYVHQLN